ncbi:hypothetical protein PV682_34240 [Streptomyces niveiscabiei]|uniref:hypothetical protein n=1 Tax=Streptomyces niveiscabiei TaxID=164115 RepID=UPI0029A3C9F6|nr:hypothetical protein [Streptomyces niveiscabiei]MDX3386473.1 hypothetical protein [Streptomyces niveiscabiei]
MPDPEPLRVPDDDLDDLDDLASTLAKTMAEVRQHGVILNRLGSEPAPAADWLQQPASVPAAEADGPVSTGG